MNYVIRPTYFLYYRVVTLQPKNDTVSVFTSALEYVTLFE
jgi:hypothetical protein